MAVYDKQTKLTAKEIQEIIPEKIEMIQIHKAIKTLCEQKLMRESLSLDLKYYSLIKPSVKKHESKRDVSKYTFNGQEYGKSRLALAVITDYVKKNKPTYPELCEIFPIKLIPPYGLLKSKAEALEVSKDRKRFFLNDHEVLDLSDGPVCVSNQFTKDRIEKFIQIAEEKLGCEIK